MSLIPVTLLSGALGSGKTTVLNHLLRQPEMADTLVILSELGNINLKHSLVAHSQEDTTAEQSMCDCCTVRRDLVQTLQDVLWRFSRNGQRQFKRIIIETTGSTDLAPIIHTLITNEYLANHYRLNETIVTVNATAEDIKAVPDVIKQIALADCILLTKTDLISHKQLENIIEELNTFNPAAPRWAILNGKIDAQELLKFNLFEDMKAISDVQRWLNEEAFNSILPPLISKDETNNENGIRTFCITEEHPIPQDLFEVWLEALTSLMGENILRVKGILHFENNPRPLLIEGVQHIFYPHRQLDTLIHPDQPSKLTFITRNIERDVIESSLKNVIATHKESNETMW